MEKIRILHLDDNVHDRVLVRDALERENNEFEVISADNRDKFEKYIIENDYDLILSDFNILGFDGLQVLDVVKEKTPNTPVIIVTGTGSEEVAIKAGYSLELFKPLLTETIAKALEVGPGISQTGPASRNDNITIEKHLDLLSFSPELQRLYSEVTQSIISYYKDKRQK